METPDLPVEIITYILSFLQVADRKEASLVCRSWYIASQDNQFQKNLTFKFPASSSALEVIRGLGRHPRCGVVISHLDGSAASREVLLAVGACLGPRLESLSLPASSVTESSLLGLLPRLTALRRLDLHRLDSLFMSGAFLSREESRRQVRAALAHLEELDLSDLRYLSDLTFTRLTGCTPRLRRLPGRLPHRLRVRPVPGVPGGGAGVLRPAVPADPAGAAAGAGRVAAGAGPEPHQRHAGVAALAGPGARPPPGGAAAAGVQGADGPGGRGPVQAPARSAHPGPQRLLRAHQQGGLAVASGLRHLRHLYLSQLWRVTDSGLLELGQLQELQTLDLSECVHVSGAELVKGLSSPRGGARLVSLNFRNCTYIKDLTMFSLAQLLGPSLRVLDLTSCLYLTDLSVRAIATYLPALVVLRLGRCKEITDWGLLGMVEPNKEFNPDIEMEDKGPSFTRTFGNMGFFQPPPLPFEEKPRLVTEEDLGTFRGQEGASLLALKGLQELDLSACCKLTDSSITQVVRFPDLQKLSLSMVPEIGDESLASLAWHCRSLSSLALCRCPRLTDQGVARAAPHLRRLQHLHLACCERITDRSLAVLAQHCRRLRTLDISMCKDITMAAVELLQSQLPFLENVHCRFSGGADLTFAL
ncbi:hypothetical protein MATL_G00144990 [Megalops atlanticus]|uniref:F-box domain-containing protein n=1 Tax=Megalops atlanticus TaxID=7932 RepID=A0A9D3PV13_MEGAT|nr:hypothetical protein MATL_G00144990 [Megalops atlanticus]